MKTSILVVSAVLALAAAQWSSAQQSTESPDARTPPAPASTVSDAELETFADIYADLLETAAKFEAEMKSAQTQEQALALRERAQTESVAKVAQRGWTPERFNSVSEAIPSDPELAEKAVSMI